MKNDIVGIGEVLIDFSPIGTGRAGNPAYEMNPGGAPANMLAAYCALGGSAAFIGAVGADFFADFLRRKLKDCGIDISGLATISDAHTTLAYVSLDDNRQPSYHFMRENGADGRLSKDMVDLSLIDDAMALHFGGVSLSKESSREAVLHAARYAKEKGRLVTFDANYRDMLWTSEREAIERIGEGVALADIVKLSREEARLLTSTDEPSEAAEMIMAQGKRAVFVTLGADGVYFMTRQERGTVEAYDVRAVDTTGCGDAFMGAVLYQLLNEPSKMMHEVVSYANAVSALCALKYGAMPAMPSRFEVTDFLMGENAL